MRVIDNTKTSVEFSAVKVGECFYYDNCLFIKIREDEKANGNFNCFCFADNTVNFVRDDWSVRPVDADVIIRRAGVPEN